MHVVTLFKVINPETFNAEKNVVLLFIVILPLRIILILSLIHQIFLLYFVLKKSKSPHSALPTFVIMHPISQQYLSAAAYIYVSGGNPEAEQDTIDTFITSKKQKTKREQGRGVGAKITEKSCSHRKHVQVGTQLTLGHKQARESSRRMQA